VVGWFSSSEYGSNHGGWLDLEVRAWSPTMVVGWVSRSEYGVKPWWLGGSLGQSMESNYGGWVFL
jgi:hypothetical protein